MQKSIGKEKMYIPKVDKFFNIAGPAQTDIHYTLDPLRCMGRFILAWHCGTMLRTYESEADKR